jgi:hypothetical protein
MAGHDCVFVCLVKAQSSAPDNDFLVGGGADQGQSATAGDFKEVPAEAACEKFRMDKACVIAERSKSAVAQHQMVVELGPNAGSRYGGPDVLDR